MRLKGPGIFSIILYGWTLELDESDLDQVNSKSTELNSYLPELELHIIQKTACRKKRHNRKKAGSTH